MLYNVSSSAHAPREQHHVRRWCADNGILTAEVLEPLTVDAERATITVQRKVPVQGQSDEDFPELLLDDDHRVVTVEEILPLTVAPPTWMLQQAG
jgi:hypothetical protein